MNGDAPEVPPIEVHDITVAYHTKPVLWNVDVYRNAAERQALPADPLALEEVAAAFDADLGARGENLRFDLDRLEDAALQEALSLVYPETAPQGALRSIYDSA